MGWRARPALLLAVLTAGVTGCTAAPTGRFWHVTDLQYDDTFHPRRPPRPLSCRGPHARGLFGDYGCNAPLKLLLHSIKAMKEIEPNPDFIIWTGDSVGRIEGSLYSNTFVLQIFTDEIKEKFAGIKLYPSLGNNDFYPSGAATDTEDKFYADVAEHWKDSFDDEGQKRRFKNGGFYSAFINEDLIVVVLNTNLYYKRNHLIKGKPFGVDPAGQFAWLESLLHRARLQNDKVIITGHVPPGILSPFPVDWMVAAYQDRLVSIISDHSDVITAMHFGHNLIDNFMLVRSEFSGCRPGWVPTGHVCIKLTAPMTWNEGRKACQALGADIATPATPKELLALLNMARKNGYPRYVSIGLVLKGKEWSWMDGRPMAWSYWMPGRPDNYGQYWDECCAEMTTTRAGRINDVACDYTPRPAPAACQLPKRRPEDAVPQFCAPSVTPRRTKTGDGHNPSLRLVRYDPKNGRHLDYTQYRANLTQANANGKMTWEILYNFTSAYNVPDMSRSSLKMIFNTMSRNLKHDTVHKYCKYRLGSNFTQPCTPSMGAQIACAGLHTFMDKFKECESKLNVLVKSSQQALKRQRVERRKNEGVSTILLASSKQMVGIYAFLLFGMRSLI